MWKDKYALAKNKTIPRPVSAFIVLLLLLLTILVPKTSAFSSESFEAHETITNAALKKFGFSSSAIGEVVDANLAQDNILDALLNTHPEYHGDRLSGETSLQAFNRLRSFINNTRSWIKGNLTKCDVCKARVALGQALHALQDFYSHSNFVDKGVFTNEEKMDIKKAVDDPSYNPKALEKLKIPDGV